MIRVLFLIQILVARIEHKFRKGATVATEYRDVMQRREVTHSG